MTGRAKRLMAFLCGIHAEDGVRESRARIAAATGQSERSVRRSLAEVVGYNWVITESHGGSKTPSTIRVINTVDWILAPVMNLASVKRLLASVSLDLASVSAYKILGSKEERKELVSVENLNPRTFQEALAELRVSVPGAHPDDLMETAWQMCGVQRKPPGSETAATDYLAHVEKWVERKTA